MEPNDYVLTERVFINRTTMYHKSRNGMHNPDEPMFKDSQTFSSFSVDDLQRAKEFYGGTLGLDVSEGPMGLELRLASGGSIFVYPKADHTPATFTILNFPVDDLEGAIDGLTRRGVHFETYDQPGLRTDEKGIFTNEGMKIAWFKDPAGNVLSLIQEN